MPHYIEVIEDHDTPARFFQKGWIVEVSEEIADTAEDEGWGKRTTQEAAFSSPPGAETAEAEPKKKPSRKKKHGADASTADKADNPDES